MRTKEQIIEEIEYYTEWVKKKTEDAEGYTEDAMFCTILAEKYTKRIGELEQEIKEKV